MIVSAFSVYFLSHYEAICLIFSVLQTKKQNRFIAAEAFLRGHTLCFLLVLSAKLLIEAA